MSIRTSQDAGRQDQKRPSIGWGELAALAILAAVVIVIVLVTGSVSGVVDILVLLLLVVGVSAGALAKVRGSREE